MTVEREVASVADKITSGPERPTGAPTTGRQRVEANLREDIENAQHLLCVSGPRGSGKSDLLRTLAEACDRGLTIHITNPKPGALLRNILVALKLGATDSNPVAGRRRLAIRLTMAEQHKRPIVVMVDDAHTLLAEDAELLFHFFPPGHATVVLAGEGDPEQWSARCSAEGEGGRTACIYFLDALATERQPPQQAEPSIVRRQRFDATAAGDLFPGNDEPRRDFARSGTNPRSDDRPAAIHHDHATAATRHNGTAPADDDLTAPTVAPIPELPQAAAMVRPPPPAPATTRQQRAMEAALSVTRRAADALTAAHAQIRDRQRLERSARRWRAATIALALVLAMAVAAIILVGPPLPPAPGSLPPEPAPPLADDAPAAAPQAPAARPEAALPTPPASPPMSTDAAMEDRQSTLAEDRPAAAPAASPASPDEELAAGAASATAAESPEASVPGDDTESSADSSASEVESAPAPVASAGTRPAAADDVHAAATPTTPRPEQRAPAAAETRLAPAEREKISRIYAERAEYEWRSGRLGAAAVSVDLGLAADPRNRRLLELRAVLRSARSPDAPPAPPQR